MWLARRMHTPGGSCIIVHSVFVFWHIEILAVGLFCIGWLFFSFFQALSCSVSSYIDVGWC